MTDADFAISIESGQEPSSSDEVCCQARDLIDGTRMVAVTRQLAEGVEEGPFFVAHRHLLSSHGTIAGCCTQKGVLNTGPFGGLTSVIMDAFAG